MSDVNDYYNEFMQEIYAKAGANESVCEEIFLEIMGEFLIEQAVIENYESAYFRIPQQGIRIDAWNFNHIIHELTLFVCDFKSDPEMRVLTQTDIDLYFNRAEKFFTKSIDSDYYLQIEESLPVYGVSREIRLNRNIIDKVNFILLSNGSLSSRFKGIEHRGVDGYKTVYDIWDISRKERIDQSGKAKEDIVIDFTEFVDNGIQCLPAFTGSVECESYLLVMPGEMLADIYEKYGERLLEQNVRTFLQFRGGVNKGIRITIKKRPEMFFAYNNGLTVTAESIEIKDSRILSVTNLQIVNGGQTTASIFMSRLLDKKEADLKKIFVQVKLSVIRSEDIESVVEKISEYANTQNKINPADFFSNHPFHKRIEDFSRRILAPSPDGSLQETYWFYERARGQYANAQSKLGQKGKKEFQIRNPKDQMFTKTDLAKFENSFTQLPHFVSKGAQWNFAKFGEEICGKNEKDDGLWGKNDLHFSELYYKQLIAKMIIFTAIDKIIMKQAWYGGYKANIVTYSLALFSYKVAELGKFIDFLGIWKKQTISEAMGKQLLKIAKSVNDIITDTDENVTQFCKKDTCWSKVKSLDFDLDSDIINELTDLEIVSEQEKDAKKEQKILKGIEAQTAVYNKGVGYWTAILKWTIGSKALNEKEISILSTTLRMAKVPPSEKQCEQILKIEIKAIKEGFYIDA